MKRAWQIIMTIVLVVILVGAVCAGVGIITGAEMSRVFSVLDNNYNITIYYEYITDELIPTLQQAAVF